MCVNEKQVNGIVEMKGEEVAKVEDFKYLGSTVQSNGECGRELKKRAQAGWNNNNTKSIYIALWSQVTLFKGDVTSTNKLTNKINK